MRLRRKHGDSDTEPGDLAVPWPERDPERNRILFSHRGDGFAYVDDRIIVAGGAARERVRAVAERELRAPEEWRLGEDDTAWWIIDGVGEPITLADSLQSEGFAAQPEHVLFAHALGCPGASWSDPCGCSARGVVAGGPWWMDPLKANPWKANPFKANPWKANPFKANNPMENTARPADARELPVHRELPPGVRILVIDTGLASQGAVGSDAWRPPPILTADVARRVTGDREEPDTVPPGGDQFLDPVAGHGTFIAGLIEQLAPGCTVRVTNAINALGIVEEGRLCMALNAEAATGDAHIVAMSLGGQLMHGTSSPALTSAIAALRRKGTVVVASAGNDGTCVPQFPAAAEDVIAVAALDSCGPASFTNWGDWVDACAPGVDLVSAFFDNFDGKNPAMNGVDIDHYRGWARWSGTSFATPVVVAALAREMALGPATADQAVERVVRAPHLLRLPCLGAVVNI